jgi:ethanolamine utilization protein EutA
MRLEVGDQPLLADLKRFTDRMADLTLELIDVLALPLAQKLYLSPPAPVSGKGSILMFSGGIGYYYYHPLNLNLVKDLTFHDDLGLMKDCVVTEKADVVILLIGKRPGLGQVESMSVYMG